MANYSCKYYLRQSNNISTNFLLAESIGSIENGDAAPLFWTGMNITDQGEKKTRVRIVEEKNLYNYPGKITLSSSH